MQRPILLGVSMPACAMRPIRCNGPANSGLCGMKLYPSPRVSGLSSRDAHRGGGIHRLTATASHGRARAIGCAWRIMNGARGIIPPSKQGLEPWVPLFCMDSRGIATQARILLMKDRLSLSAWYCLPPCVCGIRAIRYIRGRGQSPLLASRTWKGDAEPQRVWSQASMSRTVWVARKGGNGPYGPHLGVHWPPE